MQTSGCAATERRGFAFDRRGHGRSAPLGGQRSPDYLREEGLEWLPAVLAAAGISQPVPFGHSDGGSIALYYAAAHPVDALVVAQGVEAGGAQILTGDREDLERLAAGHPEVWIQVL